MKKNFTAAEVESIYRSVEEDLKEMLVNKDGEYTEKEVRRAKRFLNPKSDCYYRDSVEGWICYCEDRGVDIKEAIYRFWRDDFEA